MSGPELYSTVRREGGRAETPRGALHSLSVLGCWRSVERREVKQHSRLIFRARASRLRFSNGRKACALARRRSRVAVFDASESASAFLARAGSSSWFTPLWLVQTNISGCGLEPDSTRKKWYKPARWFAGLNQKKVVRTSGVVRTTWLVYTTFFWFKPEMLVRKMSSDSAPELERST